MALSLQVEKNFFQTLGMKFKQSGRKIEYEKNKIEDILIPDIKDENDIPEKVKDTSNMHFYFILAVNEVKRKIFETVSNGNLVKHETIEKDGIKKLLPIQKKDANGKNMFTTQKGKFVNCNQFWKKMW